jgi:hypothetical protein
MTAKRTPSAEPAPRVRGRDRAKRDRFSGARWAAVGVLALLVLTLTVLSAGACGVSGAEWTQAEKYTGVRIGDWPSPPMKLHAGPVQVSGTVTYDRAREKVFGLTLAPKEPMGPNRPYGFEMVFRPTDDAHTEAFSGSVHHVEAGEYWLMTMFGPGTCDVTVYQKGGG